MQPSNHQMSLEEIQQDNICIIKWELGKKTEHQMGFEPTTLRDLVGCSNHWATGDSMVSKGQMWIYD